MLISIVFSFRNEEENLKELIDRVTNSLLELENLSYELIFVNDNSNDASLSILLEKKKKFPIKVINMSRRFGVAPCVIAGFNNAKGDAVIYMDSDLQDPPEILPKLIYKFLEGFPFSEITSLVAITLICIFFITSMDSGALVIDTIASNGKTNTPVQQRILWCLLIGLIAIALTLSGGLGALQSMALATAFPFCFILLSMCVSTSIGIYQETEQL